MAGTPIFSLMHLAQTKSESSDSTPTYFSKGLLQLIQIFEEGSSKLTFFLSSDFTCSSRFIPNLFFFPTYFKEGLVSSLAFTGDFSDEEETGFYSLLLLLESSSTKSACSLRHLSHEILLYPRPLLIISLSQEMHFDASLMARFSFSSEAFFFETSFYFYRLI